MSRRTTRRQFLQTSALAGVGFWAAGGLESAWAAPKAKNEKLNVAFVGVGGMGEGNLNSVAGAGENVVALCDIDEDRLKKAGSRHKSAKTFVDFREMFDKVKDIDAAVVSTPDHTHAAAAMIALKLGKHVYCEKPLTWAVHEARMLRKTAAEKKVATCMGNRGTAEDGFRSGVELLHAGAIGNVKEVHIWSDRPIWPQGIARPKKETPPKHVHWDLWLGPAAHRDYHKNLHPFAWRGWVDFGTGALGDMACHTVNLTFMGLKLGYPTAVEATSSDFNKDSYPSWSVVTYQFPARGNLPAVKLVWYDGKENKEQKMPGTDVTGKIELKKKRGGDPASGALLIGDKGYLYSPDDYGSTQLFFDKEFKKMDVKRPEKSLPRAPKNNNYLDWLNACRGGKAALSNFDYSALLTESIVMGVVALRAGKKIEYNGDEMKISNDANANKLLKREYRKGWTL